MAMNALKQLITAQAVFKQAAANFVDACTTLKTVASWSFGSTPSQIAYENLVRSIQDNLDYVNAIEIHVHESRAVLNGLLNASTIRVPINKLPSEILAHIFSTAVASSPCYAMYNQRSALLNILRVCARWHQVATSTPSLWSHVDINLLYLPKDGWLDSARVWVNRCRNLPIHLHFQGSCSVVPREVVSNLVSLLQPHAASLGSLIISRTIAYPLIHALFDLLLSSGTSNSLKSLVLSQLYWDGNPNNGVHWPINLLRGIVELDLFGLDASTYPSLGETVAILSDSPTLHTLRLRYLELSPGQSQDFPTIFLPALRLLEVAAVGGDGLPLLLSLLVPGVLELDVRLDSHHIANGMVASPTRLLLARSNVVSLSIDAVSSERVEQYRSYLSVVPRLRALLLSGPKIGQVIAGIHDPNLQLPLLRSLCLSASHLSREVINRLGQVITARKFRRLVFLSCNFPRTFARPKDDTLFDDGEGYCYMPPGMMEWFSERVGRVVVGEEPGCDRVYRGLDPVVQELIKLD